MKLWVDDERYPPDETWTIALDSSTAIYRLEGLGIDMDTLEEVSLDHDLGAADTGFLVLDWMIEHDVWPAVLTIHTANSPARERMLRAANAEAPDSVEIYVKTW